MQFILTGFNQDITFRTFAFEGIAADRTRSDFTVKVELALMRKYSIRVQELPLLCRLLLERGEESEPMHTLTFSEEDMRVHASAQAARPQGQLQKETRSAAKVERLRSDSPSGTSNFNASSPRNHRTPVVHCKTLPNPRSARLGHGHKKATDQIRARQDLQTEQAIRVPHQAEAGAESA